jgi:hypothetical protein
MLVKNKEKRKKKSKIHLEFLQNWKLEAVTPKKISAKIKTEETKKNRV